MRIVCAIGSRAARFYEEQGWRGVGVMRSALASCNGFFALDVWRYEIAIPQPQDVRQ